MGKKNRKKVNKGHAGRPSVSICTPTYNRRAFIPTLIKCFMEQDYPRDLMEWIIIDDGEDCVEDLFNDVPCVKYFRVEEKMKLGRKRNFMHTKCTGDILVYMDDDDYYPPKRVSHAVSRLMSQPKAVAAGSSVVFIYFNDLEKVFQFGPYGNSHATAGTFAFKKELLKITRYNDNAEMAEEKEFLKNYTIPFVQLDPRHAILVFAHQYNTFDKRKLLVNPNPRFVRQTNLSPANFIKNKDILKFYLSVSIKK
ncbi:glycosyltransferase family 2 protein [Omnitrophica bacterium]|nr:glycosyltransferase family 2 protein [Candidatus Omnitrophota bacterium]MDB4349436.1 glycosyltransferase family 2 protein [Candidatus Omnitrophota bacterium]